MGLSIKKNYYILFLIALLFSAGIGYAQKPITKINKTASQPAYYKFNINNISTYIFSNGETDNINANPGFEYPRRSGKHSVYQSGLVWGAIINNNLHVGGSTFNSGLLPGAILPDGTAEDTASADVRIWRVRPDWKTSALRNEIEDGEGSAGEIRARYEKDWNEWPAAKGAPYEDRDSNGVYNPGTDIPGFPGAHQTIWFVANDLDPDVSLFETLPMGIEVQVTVWGYASAGLLGNVNFRKYKIINKSQNTFEKMYLGAWSDADVGLATDDHAGVDSILGLGYIYNANSTDRVYGSTPPATGFDFFQGPVVEGEPADTARLNGRKIPGKKNLSATAFFYTYNGAFNPDWEIDYALEYYHNMQGRMWDTGQYFPVPEHLGGGTTWFPLSGDPATQTGYLDGYYFGPNDKRYMLGSGPFSMAPQDTQDIILVQIAAGATEGVTNLHAVSLLKEYSRAVEDGFKNFEFPNPPPPPEVNASGLDKEIILSWSDPEAVKALEGYNVNGYKFQGYNVYQLPDSSSDISEALRIATYDIIDSIKAIKQPGIEPVSGEIENRVVQFGTDSGIKKFITIKKDSLNNKDLNNGARYYFAVTSYTYNPDNFTGNSALESPLKILTCVPQGNNPGERFLSITGDTLFVYRLGGTVNNNVNITAVIVDPSAATGHTYNIRFAEDDTWSLIDSTTGDIKLTNQSNQSGDENFIIIDGILVRVSGPREGFAANGNGIVEIAYAGQPIPAEGYDIRGREFNGNCVWHGNNWYGPGDEQRQIYQVSAGDGDGSISRIEQYAAYINGRDFEIRFTSGGGYGVYAFTSNMIAKVPFELWDIGVATPENISDDKRMIPFLYPNTTGIESTDWGNAAGSGAWYGYPVTDWIYWMDPVPTVPEAYERFAQAAETAGGAGNIYPFASDGSPQGYWAELYGGLIYPVGPVVFADSYDQDSIIVPPPGSIIRFNTNKVNSVNDIFGFKAPAVNTDTDLAKQDVEKIKAFPNPYYAFNSNEHYSGERFVTFSHLPPRADIKVFDLAGQLVRRMQKDDPGQFFNWDLMNDYGVTVASGIFIVQIDMPELGKNKILKVAVIQKK